jgi:hypothetical protein
MRYSGLILLGVLAVIGFTALGYRWWMDRITLAWSVAQATLDSGHVSEHTHWVRGQKRTVYVLDVQYSYFVGGNLYGGAWRKQFGTKDEADKLWKSLNELPVLVRYHPHRPERTYFDPYRDVRVSEPRQT